MLKSVLAYSFLLLITASCTALKPMVGGKTENTQAASNKKEVKFLDEINVGVERGPLEKQSDNSTKQEKIQVNNISFTNRNPELEVKDEKVSFLQIKYSLMLETEIEEVKDMKVYEFIDEWYGIKYRLGGTSKTGIDCSAFSQLFFTSIYGVSLPRTAREQYNASKKISRIHLKQGDLLFFNTRGGISHVGVYLQNNKFVHASTSGVMISDLYDTYWLKKFIGVGRMNVEPQIVIK